MTWSYKIRAGTDIFYKTLIYLWYTVGNSRYTVGIPQTVRRWYTYYITLHWAPCTFANQNVIVCVKINH